MQAMRLPCHGPMWDGQDWSTCYQKQVLDKLLPLIALVASLLLLIIQRMSSKKRYAKSNQKIAQLDPASSNIQYQTQVPISQSSKSKQHRRPSLSSAGRGRSRSISVNGTDLPGVIKPSSTAALAIFHTENAVILNEVHNIMTDRFNNPLDPDNGSSPSQVQARFTARSVERIKRVWELIGSTLSTGACAAAVSLGQDVTIWLALWTYLALLSAVTLTTKLSLFNHKAMLFGLAFLFSLSNFRSNILHHQQNNTINRITAGIQLALATLTLIPTLFFPFHTKLPIQLRSIQRTIRAQTLYGEARTAIPTPQAHRSPANSINGDRVEQKLKEKNLVPHPENQASIWSRALFGFVTPILFKHYKTQFTLDAVPDLPPGNHAASVVASFRSSSENPTEQAAYDEDDEDDDEDDESQSRPTESSPLLSNRAKKSESLRPSTRPLRSRLLLHFLPLIGFQCFFALVAAITTLTPPIFLRLILSYIAERTRGNHNIPVHMAITYAIGLAFGQMVTSICASQALYAGRTICIRLRAILIFEIINKALRRRDTGGNNKDEEDEKMKLKSSSDEQDSSKSTKRTSDGELNNLVAIDVFRVSEIGAYLHFLFPQAPVEIGLCIYLLINLLGKSALAGLAVLVLSMPLQALAARLYVKIQKMLLKATDDRLNLTNEILNCIKTVKFFAWEKPFEKRLDKIRERELRVLAYRCGAALLTWVVYLGLPMLVTLVTFAVHTAILHRPLPAETAFTALALFNALRSPLDSLPEMFINVLTAQVSLGRIDRFLQEQETTKYEQLMSSSPSIPASSSLGFSRATFTYSEDDEEISSGAAFCLQDVDLQFPKGQLSVIAGPVGSGKTTLLMSLLGETRQLSGQTFMPCVVARSLVEVDFQTGLSDTVAYCSQSPWLLGATIKENILFGQNYDERRYKAVVRACALEPDLKILEYNDETEVGEKGTSLSGGQKARVALARALYSPAKTLLIDDALSAVDVHTAKHIYRHYLKGPLMKNRTVILVTHAISLCLPGAGFVVALKDGKVVTSGRPAEVLATGIFEQDGLPASGAQTPNNGGSSSPFLTNDDHEQEEQEATIEELDEGARAVKRAETKKLQDKKAQFTNEETYGKGSVGFKAYKLYLASFASTSLRLMTFWIIGVTLFALSRGVDVVNAAWIRRWAATYDQARESSKTSFSFSFSFPLIPQFAQTASNGLAAWVQNTANLWSLSFEATDYTTMMQQETEEQQKSTRFYLGIYALLVVIYVFLAVTRDALGLYGSLQASRTIYRKLMKTIIEAKPNWFDRTPIGRIMNRLSKDVETIDQDLASQIIFFVDVTLQSVVILLVSCYTVPIFTVFAILVILSLWLIGALYVVSSRDLKRLESVSRSPIFTLVGEVLSGAVVIRAYGDASRFTRHCLRLIDKTNRPFYFLWAENRWLSCRVDAVAMSVSLVMSLFLILTPTVDAALAGFALSFTIQMVESVLWVLRLYTMMEINANSVERIKEYLDVESEDKSGLAAPAAWPSRSGSMVIKDLAVRYAPELPLVLKGISFTVKAGEKIGICGRTGSGKSSLALAFFRFLEAESGRIVIDGLDISKIRIEDIRSRLTVIPQEAQLFSGTIRSNLDPFGVNEDAQLWDALERCQLANKSSGLSSTTLGAATPPDHSAVVSSLDDVVEQGGKNYSAGQKQLLALARGLLKISHSNIVILDESTANLDQASEEKIQKTIQSEMKDATMLTIAHRLRGIIGFDKVLVLDMGNIVEYDRPSTLLNTPGSAFQELCARSDQFDTLLEMAQEADRRRESK